MYINSLQKMEMDGVDLLSLSMILEKELLWDF